MDSGRVLPGRGGRRSHRLHHADDGGAAADRVFARLRRAGFGVDRNRGVLQRARSGDGPVESGDDRADRRNAARLSDLHRQHDGVRQIAGGAGAAADHLQGPELREPGSFRRGGGRWTGVDRFAGAQRSVSDLRGAVAAVRRAADHTDRRRGHAHRDRAAEFVCRVVGQRDGICAEQQAADRGRRAGWIVRIYSFDHHVPGHEPVFHQRAVRRVRPVADQCGRGGGSQAGAFGHARRRGADSGFRAQRGGDSGLRNGRGAGATQAAGNVRYADASAAWTCGSRFIRWRDACRGT